MRSNKVFPNKKKLKKFRISIRKSLNARRIECLSKARYEFSSKNVWTVYGMITFSEEILKKPKTYSY